MDLQAVGLREFLIRNDKAVRVNISVPARLRARMLKADQTNNINWSAVACAAIEARLNQGMATVDQDILKQSEAIPMDRDCRP